MERDFVPTNDLSPTILGIVQPKPLDFDPRLDSGISAARVEDLRWKRRDLKSTSLLAQVLAKSRAHSVGAGEAILHEGGIVTEGGSTTVFGVNRWCCLDASYANNSTRIHTQAWHCFGRGTRDCLSRKDQ